MVEEVEGLSLDAQLHMFRQLEPLGEIEIAPNEIGTAQRVSAEIAELARGRAVAAGAGAGARIHRRNEGVRVEPLNGSRLSDAWGGRVLVHWHAGNNAGILRTA